MSKYHTIIFRVTEEEKNTIKAAAKDKSLSISSFVRFYALEKAKEATVKEEGAENVQ